MTCRSRAPRRRRGALLLALAAALALPAAPARPYDAEAGRQKAEPCAACHGPQGNSTTPGVPSLAGQPPRYLILALYQFRAGRRQSEAMTPFAAPLADEDLGNLAAYFAAQAPAPPRHETDPARATAAAALAQQNHCVECHGPALLGQEHIPRLAGQDRDYVLAQLRGFKAATRADIDGLMTSAAQPLSDADIDLLADYLAGLR
ncbi:MAG TPA: c-type cytochrome [Stellaceae bacterium]|nr:c-type cytochrome [Stellaceae bacterium]